MRVSQKLVIAIYGRSCTGKSTVAEIIAQKHVLPIRHCGDVTQRMAAHLSVDVRDLTDYYHRKIDAETVEWIYEAGGWCVVEGRYLDQVLAPMAPRVMLVRFEASVETRAARWRQKAQRPCQTIADIRKLDSDDDAFRKGMYKGRQILQPAVTIDTTCPAPEEIAYSLIQKARVAKNGHD